MFRLFGRQTFQALRSPLRLLTLCHIYSLQVPYFGPPGCAAVCRRLSSRVDCWEFFARGRQQEAQGLNDFVDIPDLGGVDPKVFQDLVSDIDHEILENEISEELGMPYLSKATDADAKLEVLIGDGYIYGWKPKVIVPFVVCHGDEARWVFFIVDTECPLTYVSVQASKILGADGLLEPIPVTIAGHQHRVYISPEDSYFAGINVLGGDFCNLRQIFMKKNHVRNRATLYFDQGGRMPWPKPQL